MTEDLHARAEAIAAGMTKGPWTAPAPDDNTDDIIRGKNGERIVGCCCCGSVTEDDDMAGILLLANLRHELLAVVRAAADVVAMGCDCISEQERLALALAAYDEALARELGGEPLSKLSPDTAPNG